MTNEEIRKIYIKGLNESHEAGLRAVYEAGVKGEEPPVEPRPFNEMTNAELRAYLDARNIAYPSGANKLDLELLARA